MLDWAPTADGGVTVRTERGTYSAGRLVITSGGWIARCGAGAGAAGPDGAAGDRLVHHAPAGAVPARAPSRSSSSPSRKAAFYGFPLYEHPGFKLGGPHFGARADGPARGRPHAQPAPGRADPDCLKRYLPDAAGAPLTLKGCVYSVTPDEDFIIDAVPGVPQAVFASCCSGHGFKFASAIGEILADLSTDTALPPSISPRSRSAASRPEAADRTSPWPAQPITDAASSPCSLAMPLFVCNDIADEAGARGLPGRAGDRASAPASPSSSGSAWSTPCARAPSC